MEVTREIINLLKKAKNIAVVGLSDDPSRASYQVSQYMKSCGYQIIPVNPNVKNVFSEPAYKNLSEIPKEIRLDIVDIFRRSEHVPEVVDEAIKRKAGCIWMQLGVVHEEAAKKALEAGIPVVMDTCIALTHRQLQDAASRH